MREGKDLSCDSRLIVTLHTANEQLTARIHKKAAHEIIIIIQSKSARTRIHTKCKHRMFIYL